MFNGPDYDPALDKERLKKQMGKVYSLMIDGRWRTLSEIASAIDEPEASISAQLRHLRKAKFGGYLISKRRRGNPGSGLFEYQLLKRKVEAQLDISFELPHAC